MSGPCRCSSYFNMFGFNCNDIAKKISCSQKSVSYNLCKQLNECNNDETAAKKFLDWVSKTMSKNHIRDAKFIRKLENNVVEYLSTGNKMRVRNSKKRKEKKSKYGITKIEYGGIDLTESDKIDDIYCSCIKISELCEDYMNEEQSYKDVQRSRVDEIKDIFSKIAKTLN